MTEKLYFNDSFLDSCDSKVLDIINEDGCFLVELDKTVFFPTGGGQPCDKGHINGNEVYDVTEADGKILHKLNSVNFFIGDCVTCKINWQLRFTRMQSHTGEHIFSGVAHNIFNVENVGFHMDNDCIMTVDFNKFLSKEQLSVVERKANEFIYADYKINTKICSSDDAVDFEYRSKLELTENIRIVEIENVDKCACCAPHLDSTGQVGIIKVLSSVSHRGGVRITLIGGYAAFVDYSKRHEQIVDISTSLCAKHDEADIGVNKLIEANSKLRYQIEQMRLEHLRFISSTIKTKELIIEFFDSLSIDDLRMLSNFIKENGAVSVILLSGNDSEGYSYCINSDYLDMNRFRTEFNSALRGSGGGKGSVLQGKLKATRDEIYQFVNNMEFKDYENA